MYDLCYTSIVLVNICRQVNNKEREKPLFVSKMFCCSKFDLIGMLLNKEDFLYKMEIVHMLSLGFRSCLCTNFSFIGKYVVYIDDIQTTYIDFSKSTLLQKSSIVSQQTRSSAALVFSLSPSSSSFSFLFPIVIRRKFTCQVVVKDFFFRVTHCSISIPRQS